MRSTLPALLSGIVLSLVVRGSVWSQAPALPEGLRQLPRNAMGFVYFRSGRFLQSELGKSLWGELARDTEVDDVVKKLDQHLGVGIKELESVTIVFMEPAEARLLNRQATPLFQGEKGDQLKIVPPRKEFPERPKQRSAPEEKKEEALQGLSPVAFQAVPQMEEVDAMEHPWGSPVLILTTTKPLDRKNLLKRFMNPQRAEGSSVRLPMLFLSERSLALGEPQSLLALADSSLTRPKSILLWGPALADGGQVLEARFLMPPALKKHVLAKMRESASGPEMTFYPLVNLVLAGLTVQLDKTATVNIHLEGKDPRTARLAAEAVRAGLSLLELGAEQLDQQKKSASAWLGAFRKALADIKVEQQGAAINMKVQVELEPKLIAAAGAEIAARLRSMGARRESENNLKQIALAMHNYHDTYRGLPPPAITNKAGKPLLSWRVAILPFIEENTLYQQFKLAEAWDSPHNKSLLQRMPRIYADPTGKTKGAGLTFYQVFVGPGTPFEPLNRSAFANIRFTDIVDGTSNTFMVVEAGSPVLWTKPDDIPFDPKMDVPRLGGLFADGFNAAFCDGSVQFIRRSVPQTTLRLLIQRNDGNVIPPY